jgi:hypothetical protein
MRSVDWNNLKEERFFKMVRKAGNHKNKKKNLKNNKIKFDMKLQCFVVTYHYVGVMSMTW